MHEFVMLVVSIPTTHADHLRRALADAGAGNMGNYSACSFSYPGIGRFIPGENAHPTYGQVRELSRVAEERIEVLCLAEQMEILADVIRKNHPYEEPAYHFIPVLR